VRLDDSRSHAVIEAIPLPAKAFSKAPIYFKKVLASSTLLVGYRP
jgi:hypothetical protein